jgi:hypothetical protein
MGFEKYEKVIKLSHSKFKRCTVVSKFVFELMILVVTSAESVRKKKQGRTNVLSIPNQLILLLEYYREYRTFFHLGLDYGLNESNVQRNIEKIEGILLKSGYFRLSGKRALSVSKDIDSVRIDVTECRVQRPKKK